jgi:hypothetical protein
VIHITCNIERIEPQIGSLRKELRLRNMPDKAASSRVGHVIGRKVDWQTNDRSFQEYLGWRRVALDVRYFLVRPCSRYPIAR